MPINPEKNRGAKACACWWWKTILIVLAARMLELLGHLGPLGREERGNIRQGPLLENTFDVLMTDVGLPALSGIDLATRTRYKMDKLDVIFATGRPAPPEPIPHTVRRPSVRGPVERAGPRALPARRPEADQPRDGDKGTGVSGASISGLGVTTGEVSTGLASVAAGRKRSINEKKRS